MSDSGTTKSRSHESGRRPSTSRFRLVVVGPCPTVNRAQSTAHKTPPTIAAIPPHRTKVEDDIKNRSRLGIVGSVVWCHTIKPAVCDEGLFTQVRGRGILRSS